MMSELKLALIWTVGALCGALVIYGVFQYESSPDFSDLFPIESVTPQATASLPMSEAIVQELENAWDALPRSSEVVVEPHGWRIVRLDAGSPLASAGFRQGELIPSDRIDATLAAFSNPENTLAQRIVKILNRLSR